jgi:ribonuclease P protein component
MAFPKQLRLKDTKIISQVVQQVRPIHEGGITLRVNQGNTEKTVVAVLVPRSAAPTAVARNAMRRAVTEEFRKIIRNNPIAPRKKIVIVVRSIPIHQKALHGTLVLLLNKSGILLQ